MGRDEPQVLQKAESHPLKVRRHLQGCALPNNLSACARFCWAEQPHVLHKVGSHPLGMGAAGAATWCP